MQISYISVKSYYMHSAAVYISTCGDRDNDNTIERFKVTRTNG